MPTLNHSRVDIATNLGMAAIYMFFLYIHGSAFMEHQKLSSLLLIAFETVLVALFLFRQPTTNFSKANMDWIVGIGGTAMPLFLRPEMGNHEYMWAHGIQLMATTICLVGALSLNKSFGIVPANRGVKTKGAYRFIRHPIYAGYFINHIVFLCQNLSVYNAVILGLFTVFQLERIKREERWLLQDTAYQAFATTTRYRLIPFVW
jgi:protein-S-isoprenylcysteine O-methyltransferase Ste14